MERGNEFQQESQFIEFERDEEERTMPTTKEMPESLPGEMEPVMGGFVKVINICTLLDVLTPGWETRFGDYEATSKAVQAWVAEHGAHYYAADREDFSMVKAAFEAERAGKRVVVVEDLS